MRINALKQISRFAYLLLIIPGSIFAQATPTPEQVDVSLDNGKTSYLEDLRSSAERGDVGTQESMGDLYYKEYLNGNADINEAIRWYKMAVERGSVHAAVCLGDIYGRSQNLERDPAELVKWYTKASDWGNCDSTWNLAEWYRDGSYGIARDDSKAVVLFQRVIDEGCKTAWGSLEYRKNEAMLAMAQMYASGRGVTRDTQKARELLAKLTPQFFAMRHDARYLLSDLDGYELRRVVKGDARKDHPYFPRAIVGRRIYQKKGKSYMRPYILERNGTLTLVQTPTTKGEADTNDDRKERGSGGLVSHSRKWAIELPEGEDLKIGLVDLTSDVKQTIHIPDVEDDGYGVSPIGWDPRRDLYYFSISEGTSTDHHGNCFQLNPATRTFTFIGSGVGFSISPFYDWVIWIDGVWVDYADRQVHAYHVDSNTDYTLSSGHSDSCFMKWLDVPRTEGSHLRPTDAEIFIGLGKKHYLKKEYEKAIEDYQRAINADPGNSEAFGLEGYSHYRNGQSDEAVEALQTSIKLNPKEYMSYYNLALVLWSRGEKIQAIEQLKSLFTMEPKYKTTIKTDSQYKEIILSDEYKVLIENAK